MDMDRYHWEYAEALAPEIAACACRLEVITMKALWRMQLAIYKAARGDIKQERAMERIHRAAKQSRRDAARGLKAYPLVQTAA